MKKVTYAEVGNGAHERLQAQKRGVITAGYLRIGLFIGKRKKSRPYAKGKRVLNGLEK